MRTTIKISIIPILLVTILLNSCIRNNESIIAKFPESPTNLVEFNTEYDDYNSTAPSFGETFPFCFSSNRNSQGNNFDIVYMLMSIEFDKDSRELEIFNNENGNLDVVSYNENINNAIGNINTSSNEFGPYLIPNGLVIVEPQTSNRYESYIMLYSNDEGGNQDIRFTHNLESENYVPPINLSFVNSNFDDSYPSLNSDFSQLFFASNREGEFNIYSHDINTSQELIEALSDSNSESVNESMLSSIYDDTCPFIIENVIVFTSNREGGYGGFDLYYSIWESNQWSTPINFGEKINSEYDEFRPIIRNEEEFENDIMIFSSNRPGGKGGFDLYFVGIDELRE